MEIVVLIFLFYGVVIGGCLAYGGWRKHMMLKHPERFVHIRRIEKDERDRKLEIAEQVGKVVGRGAVWLLKRLLSQR
ncbi:MAG TPA: hypothetical protein VHZ24_22875 [Pirellulales bacterium]|jgi:hypothetical protein|nr:hypothetical protein [Pirellulales bacterium]